MEITVQDLKFSEYNHALYIKNKILEVDETNIICFMIKTKNILTKNIANVANVETKKIKDKTVIFHKEFKIYLKDGKSISFDIYENKEIENVLKKFKKHTQKMIPLLFDNFLEESPLIFNSDNYCYVNKNDIQKVTLKEGHKDLGEDFYLESEIPALILKQETEGCINFKILELDIGVKKIKLNMYLKKTLEYNELYAPGLITVKQKIKKML